MKQVILKGIFFMACINFIACKENNKTKKLTNQQIEKLIIEKESEMTDDAFLDDSTKYKKITW